MYHLESVLWIHIGFNADPDPNPAFYLNADSDPGSQINKDSCGFGPGSWSDFKVTKSLIYNLLKVGNRSKNITYEGSKAFSNGRKPGFFVNFCLLPCHAPGSGSAFPIRIRTQDSQMRTDPDPQHWLEGEQEVAK